MKLVVMHHVWSEVLTAAEWYQAEATGLGATFVDEVHEALGRVEKSPLLYPML